LFQWGFFGGCNSNYKVLYDSENEYIVDLPMPSTLVKSMDIVVSNITFKYPSARRPVIKNASFVIPHNKSVAFIGESGAGKSTLVDIILGILTPMEGSVTFNGTSIHHNASGWSKRIGYVPQVIYLLDDTILANVAFGIEENLINEDKVWRALENAKLKDHIKTLPNGLLTTVGERGVRLSGGQRQRIGIARALYHNPPILIFDEATSNNETESFVIGEIQKLQGSKTIIIVAHRLTTIEHCDIVYKVAKKQVKQTKPRVKLSKIIVEDCKNTV